MEEDTKTTDEAPEVTITRAKTGKVENGNPQARPSDTFIGLLVVLAIIYMVVKLLRRI